MAFVVIGGMVGVHGGVMVRGSRLEKLYNSEWVMVEEPWSIIWIGNGQHCFIHSIAALFLASFDL